MLPLPNPLYLYPPCLRWNSYRHSAGGGPSETP